MNFDRFRNHPVIRDIEARQTFTAVAEVSLRNWDDLDEATCWLQSRWQHAQHSYRRRINAALSEASFELADKTDAVEFSLRFA